MVDDVLRMRATVVSDQALAELRKIGREIGIVGQRGAPGIKTINAEFTRLGQTVRMVGREITSAIPALGGMGLGAAGIGLAVGQLARTMGDAAKRVVELKHASKELGMSERDLRAWQNTAEKAGVSAQSMMSGMEAFKKTTDGLKYNIGGARDELYSMGAGPIVQRLQAARTQAEKMKIAFDFKEQLQKADPSGFKARMFFDQIGLGADKARLSLEEFVAEQAKLRERTAEEIAAAEKYAKALVDLGSKWDDLKVKAGVNIFPTLTTTLGELERIMGWLEKIDAWTTKDPLGALAQKLQPPPAQGNLPPEQQRGPRTPAESLAMGYSPISFRGFGDQGGGMSEGSRMVKDGVFAALVEFQSYVQTGGQGGAGGFTPAAFGGSAGAAAGGGVGGRMGGGGGWGGGGYSVVPEGGGGGGTTPGVSGGGQGAGRSPAVGGVPNAPSGSSVGGAPAGANTSGVGAARGRAAKGGDPRGMEAYIREQAVANGIDPDTAVAVAKSEGLASFQSTARTKSGAREESWGAFQLYTGGGLGNKFQKETGLDPRDPKNEKETIKYALKHASKHGWGSWYGARNTGIGNWAGIGGSKAPDGQAKGARNTAEAVTGGAGGDWVKEEQSRVAGTRKGALSPETRAYLQAAGAEHGLRADVYSGGQRMHGAPGAVGSHRHDRGGSGDLKLFDPKLGRYLDSKNPADAARMEAYVASTVKYGATGVGHGAGYMGTKSLHIGGGRPASWGGSDFIERARVTGMQARGPGGQPVVPPPTQRIDTAVDNAATGGVRAEGSVNVSIESNGTAAKANAKTDGSLFGKTTVENYRQMSSTSAPATVEAAGP